MGLISDRSYEDLLGDALEALIRQGTTTLEDFVAGLNAMNLRGPNGQTWKPDLLETELARLGA